MRNKLLSIFLATLMIFGGSFASFAVDPIVLDYIGPINVQGPGPDEMNKVNQYLIDNEMDPFLWWAKIENQGTVNDYINFTPPMGGTNTYTLHYNKAIPDVIWNETEMKWDIVPSNPPRKLEYFIIKSATNAYIMILPEPLSVGESVYISLPTDISHAYVVAYETTELYSIISGYKYDADTEAPELPIYGVSFDFEIYDEEDNLVAIAFSDPNTGELKFPMLDEFGVPVPDDHPDYEPPADELDLPEGTFFIKEVNIPEGYEFVRFEVWDSLSNLIDSGDEDPIIEFLSEDGLVVSFFFFNRMKDSTINAFKFNADEEGMVPIAGVPFDFEVWEDKEEGEKVAIGRSDDTGKVLFYTEWDLDDEPIDPGVEDLLLLYGNYIIKEVNLPDAFEFIRFAMYADGEELDMSEEGDDPEYPFSVGDVNTFRFEFYNRMKDSTINAFKFNADEDGIVPIAGVIFDFEVWEDKVEGEKVAVGRSDDNGDVWFYDEWPTLEPGTKDLVLPYGDYIIKEVNLPTAYEFIRFAMYADGEELEMSEEGDDPEFPFSAGEVDSFRFEFYNRMKDSIITGIKLDENDMPFDGISFNFEIFTAAHEKIANAVSNPVDGTLWFAMLDEFGEPILPRTDSLVLPFGDYYITELDLTGYDFVKAQLTVDGVLVIPDFLTPTVPFSAGDAETIHFIYNNVKEVEYKDETAYAIYGPDGGGTLNSIRGNKNWGWYINAPTLGEGESAFYNIYAGAAKNDISKGTYVGQVEVGIENGYFVTTFHLIDIVVLGEVHFGSYVNDTDIPKGPGQYSQTILAADAKFIVIHMVVWIPQ